MFIDFNILNNTGYTDLPEFLFWIINFAISFSVLIVVISLVLTGFKYIFSMGDEEKIKEATRSLMFSILGLVIVFLSPMIIEFIINEILTTKITLSETRIEQFDIEAAVIYATDFIQKMDRQWFDLSPDLRPRFQKLVFPDGIPYSRDTGFGTTKLGLIYEFSADFAVAKSNMVGRARFELAKA